MRRSYPKLSKPWYEILLLLLLLLLLWEPSHSFSSNTRVHSISWANERVSAKLPSRWGKSTPKRVGASTAWRRPADGVHPPSLRHRKTILRSTSRPEPDRLFNGRTTIALVSGQCVLIVAAMIAALLLNTPNLGFGPYIVVSSDALLRGSLYAVPLFGLAALLDIIEDRFPALQDVSKATQRSVIALLGGTFKPVLALIASVALGLAAGIGEELLFRGVLQYELSTRLVDPVWAVGISSIIFGALHAVTPLYALLATLASVFFGFLYESTQNLAIPIACHAFYDVGALLWSHWTVTQMPESERDSIANWQGPGTS